MSRRNCFVAQLIAYLRSRPLKWYLLLIVIVGAGPFGLDFVFLVDLVMTVGIDVFVLSVLYYCSGSAFEWSAAWRQRCGLFLVRRGAIWPSREWIESPSSVALSLGHNACMLVTPVLFVGLAAACFAAGPALASMG